MVDMKRILLIVSLVWYGVQCTDSQKISVDQPEEWIDPTDMVGKGGTHAIPRNIETCYHPFLRRFVSVLYKKLENVGDPSEHLHYIADIQLDAKQWTSLKSFADTCGGDGKDVTDLLESMITDVSFPKIRSKLDRLQDYFHISQDFISMAGLILVLVAILIILFYIQISWYTLLKKMFILSFILSFPWTYIHEYKIAVAEAKAKGNTIPENCLNQEDKGFYDRLVDAWRSSFSVSKDPCAEYHKYYLISPLLKVPPTKVIAITITRFFVEPLEHMATAFSKAFRNVFSELPTILWLPAFIFIIIFLVLVIVLVLAFFSNSSYVNLPFWSRVQMGPHQQVQNDEQQQQMLENNSPSYQQLHEHIDQLNATIRTLEQRQNQAAIEQPPLPFSNTQSKQSKSTQQPRNPPMRYQDVQKTRDLPYPNPRPDPGWNTPLKKFNFDMGDGVRHRSGNVKYEADYNAETRGGSGNGHHLIGFEHLVKGKHKTSKDPDPASEDMKAASRSERKFKNSPDVLESLSRYDHSSEIWQKEGTTKKDSPHLVKPLIEEETIEQMDKVMKQGDCDDELSYVVLDQFKMQAEEGILYPSKE